MKKHLFFIPIFFLLGSSMLAADIKVQLTNPEEVLKMGDVIAFKGKVENIGNNEFKNVVVYISLISLKFGKEEPVDLEDWSVGRAVHINEMPVNSINLQDWKIRLIQSGHYGVFLTVINPTDEKPVVSSLLKFNILPKKTVDSSRIIPVALGMPIIITLFLLGIILKKQSVTVPQQ